LLPDPQETQFDPLDSILIPSYPGPHTGDQQRELRTAKPEVPPSGIRILVVEDNAINCALATAILANCGHSPVHAANGLEAVKAAAGEAFDLILMDVQMPEMDGFEATRRIREFEHATGRHTPIVAMTAHTMTGDRERCLAAEMDNYLSKPLDKAALLALIQRIPAPPAAAAAPPVAPDPVPPTAHDPSAPPIFSREKLLEGFDGDEVLLLRLIVLFQENTPRLLNDIRGSIARRAGPDLAFAAHALHSYLGVFGADYATHLNRLLEAQADHEVYQDTPRTFAALERGMADIDAALARIQSHPGAPPTPPSLA
jgi:CheY-like chemotaxis protein/HPt (histidine-containing phosphotransfer) domain-containing protein